MLRITYAYTYGRLPVRCHGAHRDSSLKVMAPIVRKISKFGEVKKFLKNSVENRQQPVSSTRASVSCLLSCSEDAKGANEA